MRTRCAKITDDIVAVFILQDFATKEPIVDLKDVKSMPIISGTSELVYNQISDIIVYVSTGDKWCVLGVMWIGSLHLKADEFDINDHADMLNLLYAEYFKTQTEHTRIPLNDIRDYLADMNGALFKIDRRGIS